MTTWYIALPATIVLIAASAFFVVIEFALLAARRNRLEKTAETSAASRAALRSLNELTVMLAGAQLGITVCTFALGAVTKPWVHDMLLPVWQAAGLPLAAADTISFVLALFIVTFLHLVIGEMAPKSWAIAHPDTALRVIALPARGFITVFRLLLVWVNKVANRLVIKAGQKPVEAVAARGYDPETLQLLVEHSRETGSLDEVSAARISGVIELENTTAGEAAQRAAHVTVDLPHDATVGQVHDAALQTGNLRLLIRGRQAQPPEVIHVRDVLNRHRDLPAAPFARPVVTVAADASLADAVDLMRRHNEQIAIVAGGGSVGKHLQPDYGVLTWDYILTQLWPGSSAAPRHGGFVGR